MSSNSSKINSVDEIEMRPISSIKPYVRNPRRNDKTTDILVEIIPKVGFNVPIVVDEKGVIVKGHSRFKAAIKLGMDKVPCVVTHADEESIKLDRIADNRISEFSDWIDEGLMHELDMLNIDFDLSLLDFKVPDFDDMFDDDIDFVPAGMTRDEARLERFRQMEQEHARAEFVSDRTLENAKARHDNIGNVTHEYYRTICEKCGHVSYVRKRDLLEIQEEYLDRYVGENANVNKDESND